MKNKDVIELAKMLWENKEVAIEVANVIFKLRDAPAGYPIYKRNSLNSLVVKFTDLTIGTVIIPNKIWKPGDTYSNFAPYSNKEIWEDVPYDSKRGLYHGQPVECRDHKCSHWSALRFYDAINKCVFTTNGELNGSDYTHIEAIPTELIPPWMYEKYLTLEGI